MRLDRLLTARFPAYSRVYFQDLIAQGLVLVNGESVKKRRLLSLGDEVEVEFALTPSLDLQPENIPLDILYEDDFLLIINKRAGMVVHPGAGHWSGTFAHALLYHCQHAPLPGAHSHRPGIVHRLDKETSGLLLAAKNDVAHRALVELFATRQIQKEYRAICHGNPGDRCIQTHIGRHPMRRVEMAVLEEGGKEAITLTTLLTHRQGLSYVALQPKTGRTHQLRIHMKHVGAPILGDPLYGNAKVNQRYGVQRQMLHAYKLSFMHPMTHREMCLQAPLPKDMEEVLKKFIFLEK